MSVNFPTSLDSLTNPLWTDGVAIVDHAEQHADANDAIEALQAKVWIDDSDDTNSLDYKVANKQDTLVSWTNIKTINSTSLLWSGDIEISGGGGSSLWTSFAGTRASNTTITVSGDVTATFKKGMIIKWTDTTTHVGMVSIPSTESGGTTTITIIGDTCSADATDFYYCLLPVETMNFAVAGTIGATGDDVANAVYARMPYRVLGADLQVGTAGTTNSTTIDIDKATTTMFTTKPTLATTVASSPTPFTADDDTSLALGDRVRINIDAVQTTAAVDLYVQLYVFSSRFLTLE